MKLFTPNMNDEELDNLFRHAAEQYSEGYSEKSSQSRKAALWGKLQEKLDVPARTARSTRRKRGYFILLLLIAGGIFTWLVYHPGKGGEKAATGQQAKPASPVARKASPENEGTVQDSTATIAVKGSKALPKNEKEITNAERYKITQKEQPGVPAAYSPAYASRGHGAGNNPVNEDKIPVSAEAAAPSGRLEKLPALGAAISGIGFVSAPGNIPGYQIKPDLFTGNSSSLPGILATTHAEEKDSANASAIKPWKKSRPSGKILHWHFGLTAGPDWSSAAGKGWRTGVGGGLKMSYRFNSKWAVGTGVLINKKLYDARPGDYNPPDDSWRNYDVKSIDANCTIIDIPLNIEYTLWNRPAHRIFIAGGLSSFWMHEEEYTYHYKTTAGNWDQWSKEMYNKSHHLFSIINFSPGYEHSWQHLSVQVAPYIKIPVSGIGYGKVKLYSTGIHFTLQYGLR